MDDEIDLREIICVLWKRRLLIIGVFVVAILAAAVISFAMPSIYRASYNVVLGNFEDPIYATEDMAIRIMLSDELLLDAIEQLNLDVPPEKFKDFKESIEIEHVADKVLSLSVETQDKQNATKIVEMIVWLFVNRSEESYNRYKNYLSGKMTIIQENLAILDNDINQTSEVLRNIDALPGASEQLELSHSRTLQSLQDATSRRDSQINLYIDLQKQLDLLENTRLLMRSEEPLTLIRPQRVLIVSVGGILGLVIGIFAAFLREGLDNMAE